MNDYIQLEKAQEGRVKSYIEKEREILDSMKTVSLELQYALRLHLLLLRIEIGVYEFEMGEKIKWNQRAESYSVPSQCENYLPLKQKLDDKELGRDQPAFYYEAPIRHLLGIIQQKVSEDLENTDYLTLFISFLANLIKSSDEFIPSSPPFLNSNLLIPLTLLDHTEFPLEDLFHFAKQVFKNENKMKILEEIFLLQLQLNATYYNDSGLKAFSEMLCIVATVEGDQQILRMLKARESTLSKSMVFFDKIRQGEFTTLMVHKSLFNKDSHFAKLLIQCKAFYPSLDFMEQFESQYGSLYELVNDLYIHGELEEFVGNGSAEIIIFESFMVGVLERIIAYQKTDDAEMFQLTLKLLTASSPIIRAAAEMFLWNFVERLVEDLSKENYDRITSMLYDIFQTGFILWGSRYTRLSNLVEQNTDLTSPQCKLVKLLIQMSEYNDFVERGQMILNTSEIMSLLHFRHSLFDTILISPEESRFWKMVDRFVDEDLDYSVDMRERLHERRRTIDENYKYLVELLFYTTDQEGVEKLVQFVRSEKKLGHSCDYLFLLQENKTADKVIWLLYICEKSRIIIPFERLNEMLNFRHPMIEYLKILKRFDKVTARMLLLEITDYEPIHAELDEERTYLSIVFWKPRGWFSPNPLSDTDAIGKAYGLLKEIDEEIISSYWSKNRSEPDARALVRSSPILRTESEEEKSEDSDLSSDEYRLEPIRHRVTLWRVFI